MKYLVFFFLLACGSAPPRRVVEKQVVTAGIELLGLLPAGADVVAELNVARLRDNDTLGPSVRALSPWLKDVVAGSGVDVDLALDADLVAAAVYRLGSPESGLVVLVRGRGIRADELAARSPSVRALDPQTFVYGPKALVDQAGFGDGGGALGDERLRALYDQAMPFRAPGATLRLAARLSTEARIALAEKLGYDGALPASISLWSDVADDFALISRLGADDAPGAQHLAADLEAQSRRAATFLRARELIRKLKVDPRGDEVIVVWTIGPKALAKALGRDES